VSFTLRSIGLKIFGVAFGLLLMMAVTSAWSIYSTSQVNRQLTTLSNAIIPITNVVNLLGDVMLRQQIMLANAGAPGADRAEIAQMFRERSAAVDGHVLEALRLVAVGADLARLERNRLQMARMPPLLESLAQQHHRYRGHAEQWLLAPHDTLAAVVREDTADLNRSIDALVAELQSFVATGGLIVEANYKEALRASFALIAVAALVGALLAVLVARGMVVPLRRLLAGTRAVEAGRLDSEVPVTSTDEIGDLTRAFNHMVGELRSKEKIRETFGQYVDSRVVSNLIEGRAAAASSGNKQIVTVFFSDIAGFTALSERLTPGGIVALVNEYFTSMSRPIRASSGIIDKYIGDSVMAFWAPPFVDPSVQAERACAAALEQFERLPEFRARVPDLIGVRQGLPVIDMRVGLASGEAIVGSIGSEFARGFTVMGDTVNLGSRLEGANKAYGTRMLIDGATRDMAGDAIEARELDLLAVKGRNEPVRVYELRALKGGLAPGDRELFAEFAQGLADYRAGRWSAAAARFDACLTLQPDDPPSRIFRERVTRLAADPPQAWDGIWRMTSK
jgi:adenylate cyclase